MSDKCMSAYDSSSYEAPVFLDAEAANAFPRSVFNAAGDLSCDLHLHSLYSDGSLDIDELYLRVKSKEINSFAISDHDTLDGSENFIKKFMHKAAEKEADRLYERPESDGTLSSHLPASPPQYFIPAVELCTMYKKEEVHILAYFPDGNFAAFKPFLKKAIASRYQRNLEICRLLKENGYDLDISEIYAQGDPRSNIKGRYQAAAALCKKYDFANVDSVFKNLFAKNKPCYTEARFASAEEAVAYISDAGGISSLAHPAEYSFFNLKPYEERLACYLQNSRQEPVLSVKNFITNEIPEEYMKFYKIAAEFKNFGINCLEAVHSDADYLERCFIALIAGELGLDITAGSDFHGPHRPSRDIFDKMQDFSYCFKIQA